MPHISYKKIYNLTHNDFPHSHKSTQTDGSVGKSFTTYFFYSCIIYQYLHVYMSISQILHATHDTEKGKPMMLIWKWLKSSRLEPNACRRIHCCWLMRKLRVFSFISWTSDFAMMALSLTICPSTLTRNGDPMNIKSNYNISSNWRLIYWIYRFINLKGDGREKQKLLKFHSPFLFFFFLHPFHEFCC